MGENTKIEWCDHTFNPWIGCTKLTPACDFCYAERQDRHRKWTPEGWGAGKPRHRTSPSTWRLPVLWNRQAEKGGMRARVFCASLADWLDTEVSEEWRRDLLDIIRATPNLDWLLLTKRQTQLDEFSASHRPVPNVRLGVTIEDGPRARLRSPLILRAKQRGWKTFVSYEPALGWVDWPLHLSGVDWLICGGESGAHARPMDPDWARSARDACQAYGMPFFFKQWGDYVGSGCALPGHPLKEAGWSPREKKAGNILDGREWREFPQ